VKSWILKLSGFLFVMFPISLSIRVQLLHSDSKDPILNDPSLGLTGQEPFLYNLHCLGCHGMEGKGITDVPPFPGVLGYFIHIPEGREFIIQVPGVAHSDLSNREIAQLTNWILVKFSRKELPPRFQPFTEEEVERYRKTPLIDVEKRRVELIQILRKREILHE